MLVTITGPSGAELRYTNDGSTPTSESNLFRSEFSVNVGTTIKAIAILNGESSAVTSYVVPAGDNSGEPSSETVEAPVITSVTASDGYYRVTITGPEGATIRYGTSQENLATEGTEYTQPFLFEGGNDIYAVAIVNGVSSEVASEELVSYSDH